MPSSIPPVKRSLERHIFDQAAQFPVLLLTGARQVGKSTLLDICSAGQRNYVSLDNQVVRAAAKNDPKLFLQQHPPPLTIDEVQYAPELFPEIKILVDEARLQGSLAQRGMYWLTGSQQFSLMKDVQETLAGRVVITSLFGFSQDEINGWGGQSLPFRPDDAWLAHAREKILPPGNAEQLFNRIWHGSYPEVASYFADTASPLSVPTPASFYPSYIQTYIERDIADFAGIVDLLTFRRFLEAVATSTARYLNIQTLASDASIDQRTAKAWLSALETVGIIHLLPPWHGGDSKGRRIAKRPKLHFLDTGLCSYLLRISNAKQLYEGPFAGQLLESYVVAEILKSYCHNGKDGRNLYHYRDSSRREIDLVIDAGEKIHPIEVKKTANPSKGDTRHFSALKGQNRQVGKGALLCLYDRVLPLSNQAWTIPIRFL